MQIMDDGAIKRALKRISFEIIEKNRGTDNLALVGIQRRGVSLSKIIRQNIFESENEKLPLGILDITLYRDDLSLISGHPVINGTDIPFVVEGKNIVLIDDVLYTGRTVRAAIEAIMALGRPKSITLAILVDRGHRELPIRADFIGKNLPTSKNEVVHVSVSDIDGTFGVYLDKNN